MPGPAPRGSARETMEYRASLWARILCFDPDRSHQSTRILKFLRIRPIFSALDQSPACVPFSANRHTAQTTTRQKADEESHRARHPKPSASSSTASGSPTRSAHERPLTRGCRLLLGAQMEGGKPKRVGLSLAWRPSHWSKISIAPSLVSRALNICAAVSILEPSHTEPYSPPAGLPLSHATSRSSLGRAETAAATGGVRGGISLGHKSPKLTHRAPTWRSADPRATARWTGAGAPAPTTSSWTRTGAAAAAVSTAATASVAAAAAGPAGRLELPAATSATGTAVATAASATATRSAVAAGSAVAAAPTAAAIRWTARLPAARTGAAHEPAPLPERSEPAVPRAPPGPAPQQAAPTAPAVLRLPQLQPAGPLETALPARYGPGQDRQWNSAPPPSGHKPQDPRRNGGSFQPDDREGQAQFGMKNGQPPLPDGPAPPLPPNSQPPLPYGNNEPQSGQQVWTCEPCAKSFGIASQYEAHVGTHVTCSDCDFTAAKRVVAVHHQKTHGEYAGQGLKEIDVEGQKFMVLVGNSAEDIAKWREERRKKWLAMSRQPKPPTTTPVSAPVAGKRKLSVSSEEDLEEGEIEEDEEAKAQIALRNAATNPTAADSATPGAGDQAPPAKKQRKTMLCKWFMRGHCRFDEAHCKHSHDRSAFGCRAMMFKGSCAKGMYCPFSHDTAVMSGQRERSQKASKERATEQQWRGEQKSLLRKLLAKDVRVEQRKMLQIVHFLVANDFLRSSDGDVSAKKPAVKIEVLKSEDARTVVTAEASDPIALASEDVVMEEAPSDVRAELKNIEEPNIAVPQIAEPAEVVGADESVLPVVEASACEQESQGVSKSPSTEESVVVVAATEEEAAEGASSDAQEPQCNAESASTEDVVAFVPSKDTELVDAAPSSGGEPAKEVITSGQTETIESSAGEVNEAS
ncbi:hypothetical protein ON010_g246 [Phytophthora cinnamomi]|nr:hypothetical protein ON010_g246 [Phytophthora cinnamomi]